MATLSVLDAVPSAGQILPEGGGSDVVDVAHADAAARAKFTRPGPFPVTALRWRGSDADDDFVGDDIDNDVDIAALVTFTVHEHVGWLAADGVGADPTDVVKQVSFLQASRDVTLEEFRAHYRHHVEVARRHMPSLWQYVQYDVTGVAGRDPAVVRAAQGFVAVSVLWFRSTDDFLTRYFASPEDEAEFRSHEGFLDLSKAFTFVAGVHLSDDPTARV